MCMMIPNYGAFLVRHADFADTTHFTQPLTLTPGHARLKDHISAMPGQLEAEVHEGGQSPFERLCKFSLACEA